VKKRKLKNLDVGIWMLSMREKKVVGHVDHKKKLKGKRKDKKRGKKTGDVGVEWGVGKPKSGGVKKK